MTSFFVVAGIILGLIVLMVRALSTGRGSFRGPGSAASGAVYDLLNEDKRKAIEIIVEERAEHRDPETADDPPDPGTRPH